MRFLANENFPLPAVETIRQAGFEVVSISESKPGISDKKVIAIAKKENLTILTFDSDYGEIIFKHKIINPPSIVYFRFKGLLPNSSGKLLVELIQNKKIVFDNVFTVVEEENIRQRKY